MAVNLSPSQIRRGNMPKIVSAALQEMRLGAEFLELEITESLFLKDIEATIRALGALKAKGVQLAIDDFGTGYSSLAYLKRFPVDVIKIDRSFVVDVTEDLGTAAIVSAIIAMGHGLNLTVVAEGVEEKAQLDYLRVQQCDGFQGYYYSEPLSASDMGTLLNDIKVAR